MGNLDPKKPGTQPGQWIAVGLAIGAGFGVALGLVFHNLALGIAIGAGLGLSVGAAVDQRGRPAESNARATRIGVITAVIGLLVLLAVATLILLRAR